MWTSLITLGEENKFVFTINFITADIKIKQSHCNCKREKKFHKVSSLSRIFRNLKTYLIEKQLQVRLSS